MKAREGDRTMKRSLFRGIALPTVLILLAIIMLMGISVTGLTTMQSRYSLKRNSEIIAKQAALAGINEALYLLDKNQEWSDVSNWLNSSNTDITGCMDHVQVQSSSQELLRQSEETGCCYKIKFESIDDLSFKVKSTGYFQRGNTRLFEKSIAVTFRRVPRNYVILGMESCEELKLENSTFESGHAATLQGAEPG